MKTYTKPIYLDFAATTPVDPRVAELVQHFFLADFGNPHSRTHEFGQRAAKAVERARKQIAKVVDAQPEEVVFTSGATEANNLAILGLAPHLRENGLTHIVSTQIEHKAVVEPLERMAAEGFEVTLVPPDTTGVVSAQSIIDVVRPNTGLVSVMHVNNETGAIQPISEIAERLDNHQAFLHTDAAQGFAKVLEPLRLTRIDFISISGHKLFAPMGIGALIVRRRGYQRPHLEPRQVGGGQERGLRSGTVPAPLAIGFGLAAELAVTEHAARWAACVATRKHVLSCVAGLNPIVNTSQAETLPSILSLRFPGIDADAAVISLKDIVAIATGSACTSARVEPSQVLAAMGLSNSESSQTMRWSWSHLPIQLNQIAIESALAPIALEA